MSNQIAFTPPKHEVGQDISFDDRYVYVDGYQVIEFTPWLAKELKQKVAVTVREHLQRRPQ